MNRNRPNISLLVPVYNAAPWLERCLHSVATQTFRDFEAVLVDDGSTDGSGDICQRVAAVDSRFRLIRRKNGGPSAARNVALEAARGAWIMFLDADDFLEPDIMAILYDAVAAGPGADWAECACRQLPPPDMGGAPLVIPLGLSGRRPAWDALTGFARGDVKIMTSFASLWNKIYRADVISEARLRFEGVCPGTTVPVYPQEDFFFNVAYMERITEAIFVDLPLYNYQHHADNQNAVRKYRPHAWELHQSVYGTVRRILRQRCGVAEMRLFNRHYVDKTLIVLAILCRDNSVFGVVELKDKIRAIATAPEVDAALTDCADQGSQDNRLIDLLRRKDVEALFTWANQRGNELFGPR